MARRADGKGSTLEIINALGDETSSNNWRNSTEYNGTPGTGGIGAIDSIVVNEILTHTDLPLVDAIELHNPTAAAIDIGGWYLSDTDNNLKKYRVADGTVIPAGGYLVFDETQFGVGVNGFGLDGANGDDLYVTSATVAGVLQNFIDHVDFPAAVNGESFGRWPNATGKHYPMQSRSFGASNSGPRIGPVMISEIMYAPPGVNDDLEYIELLNLTDSPINLANWKFDEGVDFTFGNVTIQPRSTLVVVRFDPTNPANATKLNTFRNTYGITAAVPLVGGYGNPTGGGVLDNGGEEVRLERPDAPQPDMSIPYLLVDEVDFDSVSPWPTSPGGTGHSLTRLSQFVYGHEPSNWVGQTPSPGSFPLLAGVTGLTATTNPAQANQIHVQWNDINGEDGYRLERSPDGANWTLIATLGPDATSTVDTRLQSSFSYHYRVRAFSATLEGPLSSPTQATTPQLVTITGAAGHDTYHVQRVGTQIHVYENTAPVGQPTYSSELAALGASLTIDGLAGDDTLTVTANGQPALGVNQLLFNSGSGTNSLQLTNGAALIDSTIDAGSVLNTTVSGGAQLTTARLNQNGLTLNGAGTRVTIQPDGALANVLGSLTMDATSTLDLTNNDLVLRATAATKDAVHADAQAKIAQRPKRPGREPDHQLGRTGHHQSPARSQQRGHRL